MESNRISPCRFFVALLPPEEIQVQVSAIKQQFADRYDSKAALKSPPHITLQPPFEWAIDDVSTIQNQLYLFAQTHPAIPITLNGFGAFPPRVIYVDVVKSSELLHLRQDLIQEFKTVFNLVNPIDEQRPFAPHMTVAFRDLSRDHFKAAWPEFQTQSIHFDFVATHLTLLIHKGQRWIEHSNFTLNLDG
ncbi:MAG: 2'-5' RNA ligase family protein [Leptolyngbyaceae cyanobacterium bins.59]|nr:2'-5' RNA ligase family protein [Leptolyngbyaceae cyanobacterium bins.59]